MVNAQDKNPTGFQLKPQLAPIERFNKLPLLIAIIAILSIIIFLVFNAAHKKQNETKETKQKTSNFIPREAPPGSPWFLDKKYDKNVYHRQQELPTETSQTITEIPHPKQSISFNEDVDKERRRVELELVRLEERYRLTNTEAYIDAVKSPLKIPSGTTPDTTPHRNNESSLTYAPKNSNNTGSLNVNEAYAKALSHEDDNNGQGKKREFLEQKNDNNPYLPHQKIKALSPYELKAGSIIPAALITGINSDLPGSIIAQVRETIYDTVSGNYTLIPQGSRLIGEYDSRVSFGQNRVLIVWKRLLFPNGDSIFLDNMQGVDLSGYAGFSDKVDHHFMRIYGNAMLLSLVGTGYELLNKDSGNQETTADTVAASIGQQLAEVTAEMTRNNIHIQPTITIRPGYSFNVMVMKDMLLQ